MGEDGISAELFRAAMRKLPAQVCVVASRSAEERMATTVTAVTSVSASPPQLLVCLHHESRSVALITEAGAFSVNLLAASQLVIAARCAQPGLAAEQRFTIGNWRDSHVLGQPVLGDAVAAFECRLDSRASHGTHLVLVGTIAGVALNDAPPLLYHEANYKKIGDRLDIPFSEEDVTPK